MICPHCLEAFEFMGFDVDLETLEHRGKFRCSCSEGLVFPEYLTSQMLTDDDYKEQLRISRLLYLRKSVHESQPLSIPCPQGVIKLKTGGLKRYIEVFAEQSIRQLK